MRPLERQLSVLSNQQGGISDQHDIENPLPSMPNLRSNNHRVLINSENQRVERRNSNPRQRVQNPE